MQSSFCDNVTERCTLCWSKITRLLNIITQRNSRPTASLHRATVVLNAYVIFGSKWEVGRFKWPRSVCTSQRLCGRFLLPFRAHWCRTICSAAVYQSLLVHFFTYSQSALHMEVFNCLEITLRLWLSWQPNRSLLFRLLLLIIEVLRFLERTACVLLCCLYIYSCKQAYWH